MSGKEKYHDRDVKTWVVSQAKMGQKRIPSWFLDGSNQVTCTYSSIMRQRSLGFLKANIGTVGSQKLWSLTSIGNPNPSIKDLVETLNLYQTFSAPLILIIGQQQKHKWIRGHKCLLITETAILIRPGKD